MVSLKKINFDCNPLFVHISADYPIEFWAIAGCAVDCPAITIADKAFENLVKDMSSPPKVYTSPEK